MSSSHVQKHDHKIGESIRSYSFIVNLTEPIDKR
jgi:hypothetical protein